MSNLHPVFDALTSPFRPGGGECPVPERDPSRPEPSSRCADDCDCTACQLRRLVAALLEEQQALRSEIVKLRHDLVFQSDRLISEVARK